MVTAPPGWGSLPRGCRYQLGDRIQMHGYPGRPAGLQRAGFRGVILGTYGANCGRGYTDDGVEWCEQFGFIAPDGTPNDSAAACTCCPAPARRPHRRSGPPNLGPMPARLAEALRAIGALPDWAVVERPEQQLDLFDLIGAPA